LYARIYDHHGATARGLYYRLRWYPLHRYREIVRARIGPIEGLLVLDLGCGVGTYAIDLAARGAHVSAVDLSSSMLAHTRQRAIQAGVGARVDCIEADGLSWLGTCGGGFDLALAIGVFDYVDDPARWLHEIGRCCRALVATFPRRSAPQFVASWRYRRLGVTARVYDIEQVRGWLKASQFDRVRVVTPAFGGHVVLASRSGATS
jgi:SAM-dependent methyltransferase